MNFAPRTHRKPWAASLALVLVCALLWAQLLGLTHRVVHGPQLAGSVVVMQAGSAAGAVTGVITGSNAGLFATLFAGHQGADCSTFDQLGHADALASVQPQALPVLAPLPPLAVATVYFLLQHPLRLQARGPPASL
jgi:hypothetical protein